MRKKAPLWYNNFSEKYYQSAQVLAESKIPHNEVINYLRGLSIELLLKAILCTQTKDKPPKGHKLESLADKVGLSLNKHERDLLQLFTFIIEYAGRYPVSNNPEKDTAYHEKFLQTHFHTKDRLGKHSIYKPDEDSKSRLNQNNFQKLYRKILDKFIESYESGWQG